MIESRDPISHSVCNRVTTPREWRSRDFSYAVSLAGGLVVVLGICASPVLAASLEDDLRAWLKETNRKTYRIESATRQGNKVVFHVQIEDMYIGAEIEQEHKRDHPKYDPQREPFALDGYVPGLTRRLPGGPRTLILPAQARVVLFDYPGHVSEPYVTNAGFLARIMSEGIPLKDLQSTHEAMAELSGVRRKPNEVVIPEKYAKYNYVLRRNGTHFRELVQIYQP